MKTLEYKKCPFCGIDVRSKAVYCVNCQALFNLAGKGNPAPGGERPKEGGPGGRPASLPDAREQARAAVTAAEPTAAGKERDTAIEQNNSQAFKGGREPGSPVDLDQVALKIDDLFEIVREVNREISEGKNSGNGGAGPDANSDIIRSIIQSFAAEYSERVVSEVGAGAPEREYAIEEKKLQAYFGAAVWEKLDQSSQTNLTLARIMYNKLIALGEDTDCSGVCLLAVKALEIEVFKRFYTRFIAYLEKECPGKANMKQWPTPLLNKYDRKKPTKKYTLIGATYVMCLAVSSNNSEEQNANNRKKLFEYAVRELFPRGLDRLSVEKCLGEYAQKIDTICSDPRNPSTHTDGLKKIGASDCSALVGEVEKLLKTMLASFAK